MPFSSKPLPVNLSRRPRIVYAGISGFKGPRFVSYSMGNIWCIHAYRYRGTLTFENQTFPIKPNHISITPPFAKVDYFFAEPLNRHFCFHFQLPVNRPQKSEWTLPFMQSLGRPSRTFFKNLEDAIRMAPSNSLRAEVKLWDLLLQLATSSTTDTSLTSQAHPALESAIQFIEANLAKPIDARLIADTTQYSVTHLGRLFRSHLNQSIMDYVRQRRLSQANHWLTYSTIPIKEIAHRVGIPDLHLFNKIIRREFKLSPRKLRESSKGMKVLRSKKTNSETRVKK